MKGSTKYKEKEGGANRKFKDLYLPVGFGKQKGKHAELARYMGPSGPESEAGLSTAAAGRCPAWRRKVCRQGQQAQMIIT